MVERTVLDSGLVIITEHIPAFPSFALSYTLRGGSRVETDENCGIHHLIEHMLFQGTQKYNLREIASISDRLGGKLNAFTGKEVTQYHIKAVDEHLKESFDLLTDMVMHSTFPEEDFNKEKNVTIQEIHEAVDNPDTHAFETFYEQIFKHSGLGMPIGGRIDAVSAFQRDMVYDYYKAAYTPDNLLLAAVGKVDHRELVELASRAFDGFAAGKPRDFNFPTPAFVPDTFSKKNSSLKQVYVIMAFKGLSVVSPVKNRYMLVNEILGAGMSSRLFQKIREEKGLAYTISSFGDSYLDCGLHLIYSVVEPHKAEEYTTAVREEINRLKKEGITREELERARDSIKASVILGLEGRVARMRFNVNNELFQHREVTVREILDDLDGADVDDVNGLFREYLDPDSAALFLYGDVDS